MKTKRTYTLLRLLPLFVCMAVCFTALRAEPVVMPPMSQLLTGCDCVVVASLSKVNRTWDSAGRMVARGTLLVSQEIEGSFLGAKTLKVNWKSAKQGRDVVDFKEDTAEEWIWLLTRAEDGSFNVGRMDCRLALAEKENVMKYLARPPLTADTMAALAAPRLVEVSFPLDELAAGEVSGKVRTFFLTAGARGETLLTNGGDPRMNGELDGQSSRKAAACLKLLKSFPPTSSNPPDDPNKLLTVRCQENGKWVEWKFSAEKVPVGLKKLFELMGCRWTLFERLQFAPQVY